MNNVLDLLYNVHFLEPKLLVLLMVKLEVEKHILWMEIS